MQPETTTRPTCTVPPAGWQCSRPAGHEGPCAASPITPAQEAIVENWAILEIMGHERLAGRLTETTIAGVPMLRVDVPATEKLPGFTRMLSGASIFSLTPVPQDVATIVAGQLQKTAVSGIPAYGFTFGQQLQMSQALGLPAPKEPVTPSWGRDDDEEEEEHGPNYERPY